MTVAHNPGGKIFTPLPKGMTGAASFCNCGPRCHRLWLKRDWSGELNPPFALFIGMNPSTADAEGNDPTVTREIGFAMRWGLKKYVKVNIMDLRATNPRGLLEHAEPCTADNLRVIAEYARQPQAQKIIACWGSPHKRLESFVAAAKDALKRIGKPVECFGVNADGNPKHPLYLAKATTLQPFIIN